MAGPVDRRRAAVEALQARLGHRFTDRDLLERALTHASVAGMVAQAPNNERLEFLGDRVLGLAIAEALMEADPDAQAGPLSKRFAALVSKSACARVARELGLGEALRLAGAETRKGGRDHETILGDACEALIAALHHELGYEGAAAHIRRLWAPLFAEPMNLSDLNPKSALQEWAAARRKSPPAYREVSRTGPAHAPAYVVEVGVDGELALGEGRSLQAAQIAAARALLDRTAPR
jgi:ribonuclease-3